jgi:hypothetical protein
MAKTKTTPARWSICARPLAEESVLKASVIIGFGGGCLTSIAILAAGLISRDIHYVKVATTLMGTTDSCLSNGQASICTGFPDWRHTLHGVGSYKGQEGCLNGAKVIKNGLIPVARYSFVPSKAGVPKKIIKVKDEQL